MGPYVNKMSPLDGDHEQQVTVIVTTSGLSKFSYPHVMIEQPGNSRVNSVRELYYCWLLSC